MPANPLNGARPTATLLVTGAAEVLSYAPDATDRVGRQLDAEVAIAGDRILAVGNRTDLAAAYEIANAKCIDAQGGIVIPGFVDCHTHLVFPGSRVDEYAARVAGAGPQELAARGIPSGIPATVRMLQQASFEELEMSARARLGHMLRYGTTTVEAKSGYGLSVTAECRLLEVNKRLQLTHPIDIVSTFLGAHDLPDDRSRTDYIEEIIAEQIPAVVEGELAEFNDVYCDRRLLHRRRIAPNSRGRRRPRLENQDSH